MARSWCWPRHFTRTQSDAQFFLYTLELFKLCVDGYDTRETRHGGIAQKYYTARGAQLEALAAGNQCLMIHTRDLRWLFRERP